MDKECAVIIIDTGFNLESLKMAKRILAVYDLNRDKKVVGEPHLDMERHSRDLAEFAGDPADHGSFVLRALLSEEPDLPVVLVRAFTEDVRLIRTSWKNGSLSGKGWTEALRWAVAFLQERGMSSVTNCSFGGFTHAMDGSGWESYCLGQVTGPGKNGHVVLAGAGTGEVKAVRASCQAGVGDNVKVRARQAGSTVYNFWSNEDGSTRACDWLLEVFVNGRVHSRHLGAQIQPNLWNGKRQVKVAIEGDAEVTLAVSRFWHGDSAEESSHALFDCISFDCWINRSEGAVFLDHISSELIAEPAVFPHVIAVGLVDGKYSPTQEQPGKKPDVLLSGAGPISFRLPEVAARVARLLRQDPSLDMVAVSEKLGKFPSGLTRSTACMAYP
ncbi:MAG: hypothetical protein K2Q23_02030 [Bryobacteraceae bacterium]|nr:hypothetical protein [Bryobacteraceae bacterium]